VANELLGIERMAEALGVGDVAVIFPEGTRANAEKRSLALIKIRDRSPERYERLQKLKYLLPPKPAGLSALLAAVPQATVVTMWHSGFDGMDTFRGIVRQLAKSAVHVHVKVVEHQRSTVASGEAFIAWLDTQWAAMDESVSRHLADSAVVQHNGGIHG
jgi:1-acyl-sn-glycerol-3-phosphate acyltransferase